MGFKGIRTDKDGDVVVVVEVRPGASRTEILGVWEEAVRIAVQAPPVENRANEVLVEFLAKRLKVSKSRVVIKKGEKGRRKVVRIRGCTEEEVRVLFAL